MTSEPGAGWDRRSPRLHVLREGDRTVPATEALGTPPAVYGERVVARDGGWWRRWDPYRSKLAAALVRGYRGPVPRPSERWLYLGAATGTTASHLADLVGPEGSVYAVEFSLRPFVRLLRLAERYPNLFPLLADARRPESYAGLVPQVDGVYADVAQPDQAGIARDNAALFLETGGTLLLVLKLSSIRRDLSPAELESRAMDELRPLRPLSTPVALEPFHRQHRFLAARLTAPEEPRPSAPTRRWRGRAARAR